MKRALAALLVFAPFAAAAEDAEIPVTYKAPLPEATVSAALSAFAASCTPLTGPYWTDVQKAEATVMGAYSTAKARGSTKMIEFVVNLPETPSAIPKKVMRDYAGWGHRCFYYLFGGAEPRAETTKDICKAVCGLDPAKTNGRAAVIPIPALSVIE